MYKKSFPIATFVRHSISKLPEDYSSLPIDNIKEHVAIWKGFFAYTPVIYLNELGGNYFFKKELRNMIVIPIVRAESATLNAGQWKLPILKSIKSTTFP
jgi:hypothetical protein